VLRHMKAHVETGESLPRALFDKMQAAKNFQSGLKTLRRSSFRCSTCWRTQNTTQRKTYRQAIVKPGGSSPALESFKAFRGREPSLDALLRH
jgi:Zn-dependent oligopeptidase